MNPLVSVVIPAYNAENTIIDCLESVRLQTYKTLEILVVNDGSTDSTLALLEQYENTHKNLVMKIYTIANAGPASARNYAIAHSQGEFVAFLDSDDRWAPKKLEKQIACFLKYPDLAMLGCGYAIGEKIYDDEGDFMWLSKKQFLFKNFYRTPCVVIKRGVLDEFLFESGRKYSEDYHLWLQIVCAGYRCALLKEALVFLYDKPMFGASGLSAKLWKMEKGELRNYAILHEKHFISYAEYAIVTIYSLAKYLRRVLITVLRN